MYEWGEMLCRAFKVGCFSVFVDEYALKVL